MRVIFAGGGTGGHLFPGLAVAREFQRRDGETEIVFIGTEQGIEFRVLPKEGFKLETLTVKGIKGRGLRGILDALYGVPASVLRSLAIIARVSPGLHHRAGRLCVRTGAAGGQTETAFAAPSWSKICGRVYQQNSRAAGSIGFLPRTDSAEYFSGARVIETGNPVRWHPCAAG